MVSVKGARHVRKRIAAHVLDNYRVHVYMIIISEGVLLADTGYYCGEGIRRVRVRERPGRLRSDSPGEPASRALSDGTGALMAAVGGAKVTKGMAAGPRGVGGRRQRRQQHLPRQQRPTNRAAKINVVIIVLACGAAELWVIKCVTEF